jgi:amidohydrolase
MGSEDFSAYTEHVPGFYLKVGVRNPARGITAMLHTPEFDLDEEALPLATRLLANLVWDTLAARK